MHTVDNVIKCFEIIGIFAFSTSGAMKAIKKRIDLFGILFIGITTALGGGVIRDILLNKVPPIMFVEYSNVLIAIVAAIITFSVALKFKDQFANNMELINKIINIFDAIGLGVFTISGMNLAIGVGYGSNPFFIIFIGMITGVGGGMLRDVMLCEIPFVLWEKVYAVASLIGACVYFIMYFYHVNHVVCIFSGIIIIFLIRMLATIFRWDLPKAP